MYLLYTAAILGLEVLVAGLIWMWWQTLKTQQNQFHASTKQTYDKLSKLVEDTTREAQQTLTSALAKAEKLEKEVETQTQAIADHAHDLIKQQTKWQTTTNQKLWLAYQDTLNQESKAAIQQLNQLLTQQSDNLSEELKASVKEVQTELKTKVSEALIKAEADIETHKQTEIKRIHEAAQSITEQVARDFIGQNLEPKDHHTLVMNQLSKALAQLK